MPAGHAHTCALSHAPVPAACPPRGANSPPVVPRRRRRRVSIRRWTATRGAAIEHLVLKIRDEPDAEQQPMLLPGWAAANAGCGAALRKLSVDWDGPVRLSGFDAAPSLQKLALFGVRLRVEGPLPDGAAPSLTDLSVVRGWVRGAGINSAWLPPSLTALILSGCSLRALPGAIRHLPKLRLLVRSLAGPADQRCGSAAACACQLPNCVLCWVSLCSACAVGRTSFPPAPCDPYDPCSLPHCRTWEATFWRSHSWTSCPA